MAIHVQLHDTENVAVYYHMPVLTDGFRAKLDKLFAEGLQSQFVPPEIGRSGVSWIPDVFWGQAPKPRLDRVVWPVYGLSRWAYLNCVCDSKTLSDMRATLESAPENNQELFVGFGTAADSDAPVDAGLEAGTGGVAYPMFLVSAVPVFQVSGTSALLSEEDAANGDDLYLLTFVDRRFFFRNRMIIQPTLPSTATYEALFNQLVVDLGVGASVGYPETAPDLPDLDTAVWTLRSLRGIRVGALDSMAEGLGGRITASGTLVFADEDADADYDEFLTINRPYLLAGGSADGYEGLLGRPDTIQFICPPDDLADPHAPHYNQTYDVSLTTDTPTVTDHVSQVWTPVAASETAALDGIAERLGRYLTHQAHLTLPGVYFRNEPTTYGPNIYFDYEIGDWGQSVPLLTVITRPPDVGSATNLPSDPVLPGVSTDTDTDRFQVITIGTVVGTGFVDVPGLTGTYGPYRVQRMLLRDNKYIPDPHSSVTTNVWSPVPMRVGTTDCPSYCEMWEAYVNDNVARDNPEDLDDAMWHAHPIESWCVERDQDGAITNIGLPCADVPACYDTNPPPVDGETPATPENPCPGIGVDHGDTCLTFTNLKVVITGGWGVGGITTPAVYGPVSGSVQPLAGGGAVLSLGNISTQLPWPNASSPSEIGNVVGNVYCDPDTGRWLLQVSPNADSSYVQTLSLGTQEDGFPMVWGPYSAAIQSDLDPGAVEGTVSWDRAVLRRTGGCLDGELTTTGVPGLPGAGVLGPAVTGYAAGDIVTAGASATANGTYAGGVLTVDFGDAVVGVLTLTPDGAGSFTAAATGTGTVTVTEVIATPFMVLAGVGGGTTGLIAVTRGRGNTVIDGGTL